MSYLTVFFRGHFPHGMTRPNYIDYKNILKCSKVINVQQNILKFTNRLACDVLLLTFCNKAKLKVDISRQNFIFILHRQILFTC